jgi:hypothetical protein
LGPGLSSPQGLYAKYKFSSRIVWSNLISHPEVLREETVMRGLP